MSEPYWVPLGAAAGVLDDSGFGTSLPVSPADGEEYLLTDSVTAPTYAWRFRYVAAKATNKWIFVGGAERFGEVSTAQALTSTSYVDLATVGPTVAIPVVGDYIVGLGFHVDAIASGGDPVQMSFAIGGTAAVDADSVLANGESAAGDDASCARFMRKNALAAVTLTAKYKNTVTASILLKNRWLSVKPIAVGG